MSLSRLSFSSVERLTRRLEWRLAPILGQRLVLNLRSVEETILNSSETDSQPLPAINFAHGSVIGNIGAPLRMNEDGVSDRFDIGDDGSDAPQTGTYDMEGEDGIQMVDRISEPKRFHQISDTTINILS